MLDAAACDTAAVPHPHRSIMMTTSLPNLQLIEEIFLRASEQLGDVTPHVMDLYYRAHPEVLECFERLSYGKRAQLEGIMVENSVYCLMRWFEDPSEVEILLSCSAVHHEETLKLSPVLYLDFIDATAAVIASTIPDASISHHAVLREACGGLHAVVDSAVAMRLPV